MNILCYDIGTTGVKTCLFEAKDTITLLRSSFDSYDIKTSQDGSAEQDPDDWWRAIVTSTREIIDRDTKVDAISFCSQMQSLVLVDKEGRHIRPSMSYMDQRAGEIKKKVIETGIKVSGMNVVKLIKSLYHTGAVAGSVKDPVWKYLWVKENEAEVFKKTYKWLDVKEAIIARMTKNFVMSEDSAFATLLYDVRSKEKIFSEPVLKMLGVNPKHMPEIISSSHVAGYLLKDVADELGLKEGIAVYAGGGDASLIGVGAGAILPGDTHVYMGTSGWVSTVTEKTLIDTNAMVASIVGAFEGRYNYFAELETAGKCLEWVKDHLVLDEINAYIEKKEITEDEVIYKSLYEYLSEVMLRANPGSDGVIFTPWLHGNRCPFEDANARGIFFNLSLETGKTEMLRSVVEGVCFHLRWFFEVQDKKLKTSDTVRFVGGGALSATTSQILADIIGKTVVTVKDPQNVGAVGAAIIALKGANPEMSAEGLIEKIEIKDTYKPNPDNKAVYDKNYEVFKKLYKNNKELFADLNASKL
ncbi:MAG: carbohydrate kinase [Tissierellia bacterium]|nr:carbohydrate kinase [Tissierellia bacterium]